MVLLPTARLLPFTVRAAVAFPPDAASVTEPRIVFPMTNLTLPGGAADPLAGLTVAVKSVVPVEAIEVGLAASAVVVATIGGGVTVTVAEPVELAKLPVAA